MKNLLSDYPFIKQDPKAKSLSFFCEGDISYLDHRILNGLKEMAAAERTNLRISLHASPNDTLHNMIILQYRGTYNRPHYHENKAETYHLIEGTQTVYVFDADGAVIDRCDMAVDNVFLFRFEAGYNHMSIPTSDLVIFNESKIGPFVRKRDSRFASWAPDGQSPQEVADYLKTLDR